MNYDADNHCNKDQKIMGDNRRRLSQGKYRSSWVESCGNKLLFFTLIIRNANVRPKSKSNAPANSFAKSLRFVFTRKGKSDANISLTDLSEQT